MQTSWDYTAFAKSYDKRPDYSSEVIKQLLDHVGALPGQAAADIGAGTGRLAMHLLQRGLNVIAVEPNGDMRAIGICNTKGTSVKWCAATAEANGLTDGRFHLVAFGSSFNVTDRLKALQETARILIPGGWFTCLWNHRDLMDPIQAGIERIIHHFVPNYEYGVRREDQSRIIEESGLFTPVERMEGRFVARVAVSDYVQAWFSHATLARQAGEMFEAVVSAIDEFLSGQVSIEVPYYTRAWCARVGKS